MSTTSVDCECGLRGLQHHDPKASRVFPWGGPCPHDLLLRRLWCCTCAFACAHSIPMSWLASSLSLRGPTNPRPSLHALTLSLTLQ